MLWCGACSEQDYRDTTFYEPPHDLGHSGVLSSCATAPLDPDTTSVPNRQMSGSLMRSTISWDVTFPDERHCP
jgi:hypothetical protein